MPGNILTENRMQVLIADGLCLVLSRYGEGTHLGVGGQAGDGVHDRELDHTIPDVGDGLFETP